MSQKMEKGDAFWMLFAYSFLSFLFIFFCFFFTFCVVVV